MRAISLYLDDEPIASRIILSVKKSWALMPSLNSRIFQLSFFEKGAPHFLDQLTLSLVKVSLLFV